MAQPSRRTKLHLPVLLATVVFAVTLGSGGCTTKSFYLTRPQAHEPSDAIIPVNPMPARSLAMFEGDTGRVATWYDLIEGVSWAEVVFIGEIHDHRAAHLVEQAVVEDALASFPGTAVSMEMLERNEQPIVDAYLRGEIDLVTFVERTGSANWAGKPKEGTPAGQGTWEDFYQPMIDAAKERGAMVIAANAPRDYVRKARTEGYDALLALPPEERALFDVPVVIEGGAYRERFNAVMTGDGQDADDTGHGERLDSTFRAQQLWDSTMAHSIAAALDAPRDRRATKVIHIIGGFHVDGRAGTVTQLLKIRPNTRVLTIQIEPVDARQLRDEDRDRADLIVYAKR